MMKLMAKTKRLEVLLEGRHIGVLREDARGRHTFAYDLSEQEAGQLSLSMPRRALPWEGAPVEAYIDGILPDDPSIRQRIARRHGVNARNPFALLTVVGLDCGGGVQFMSLEDDESPVSASLHRLDERIVPIDEEHIGRRLREISGTNQDSWQSGGEHWSLNGAQDKLALRYTNGQWYEAEGAAATTHIIKPGIRGLHEQAFNEYVCLRTAERLLLPTAKSFYRILGGVPVIVSERWDRIVDETRTPASVSRVHQEDLCQAMGVMTDRKYQSDGGPGAVDIVRFLREQGLPEQDVTTFFKALVFNFLIAGSDAHAKNYAILEPVGGAPRLSPLYDIASLFAYDTVRKERRLAMSIGGEYRWERIEVRHWRRFADSCGGASDWDVLATILVDFALATLPAFLQVADEALRWAETLPDANAEGTSRKRELVLRIARGIDGQSSRVLRWFQESVSDEERRMPETNGTQIRTMPDDG